MMRIMDDIEIGKDYKRAADILVSGGVIAYATDTVYGLGCLLDEQSAVERIYEIKGRDRDKPFLLNAYDLNILKEYVAFNDVSFRLADLYWPGKLTIILDATSKVPLNLLNGRKTVGVRVPDCQLSLEMMKIVGRPVVSTSVNRAGRPAMLSAQDIFNEFSDEIDYILEDDNCCSGEPSTIVLNQGEVFNVIRTGKLIDEIESKGFNLLV